MKIKYLFHTNFGMLIPNSVPSRATHIAQGSIWWGWACLCASHPDSVLGRPAEQRSNPLHLQRVSACALSLLQERVVCVREGEQLAAELLWVCAFSLISAAQWQEVALKHGVLFGQVTLTSLNDFEACRCCWHFLSEPVTLCLKRRGGALLR